MACAAFEDAITDLSSVNWKGVNYQDCEVLVRINKKGRGERLWKGRLIVAGHGTFSEVNNFRVECGSILFSKGMEKEDMGGRSAGKSRRNTRSVANRFYIQRSV